MTKGELWTVILLALTLIWQIIVNIRTWTEKTRKLKFITNHKYKDHNGKDVITFYILNESKYKKINIVSLGIKTKKGEVKENKTDIDLEPGERTLCSINYVSENEMDFFIAQDILKNIYKEKILIV